MIDLQTLSRRLRLPLTANGLAVDLQLGTAGRLIVWDGRAEELAYTGPLNRRLSAARFVRRIHCSIPGDSLTATFPVRALSEAMAMLRNEQPAADSQPAGDDRRSGQTYRRDDDPHESRPRPRREPVAKGYYSVSEDED